MNHRHHTAGARPWRFVLAKMLDDFHAENYLVQEIGPACSACWAALADRLADIIVGELRGQLAEDGTMTAHGFGEDDVLNWITDRIAEALDNTAA